MEGFAVTADKQTEIILQVWPLKLVARGKTAVELMSGAARLLLYAKALYFVVLAMALLAVLCK